MQPEGVAPYRKIVPPWRMHGKAYYLSFVCMPCWNGRIRHKQPMKQTNFSRCFDEPDLNSKSLYSQPKLRSYPHPVRNHDRHQNCLRLHFSTLQVTCQVHKRHSNSKIAFGISKLLSKSIFVNLPTHELQNITKAVASMDQNLPSSRLGSPFPTTSTPSAYRSSAPRTPRLRRLGFDARHVPP